MRNNVTILLFIITLLFSNPLQANVYGGTSGERIINTFEGGYFAIGKDSTNYYLVNIDHNGNLIWSKIFVDDSYLDLSSVIQMPDSGFIIAGSVYDSVSGGSKASITKINISGDSLWTYPYLLAKYDSYGTTINANQDGNLIFGVSSDDIGPDNPTTLNLIDQQGAILNSGDIWGSGYWAGYPATVKDRNGYYANAVDEIYQPGFFISSSDSAGNLIWRREVIDTSNIITRSYATICNADSGFYVSGMWYYSATGTPANFFILKIDFAGNVLWERLTNLPAILGKMIQYREGFLKLQYNRLYRFNNMGDTLWSLQIPGARDFDTIPQGGFVFTGDSINQLWISITDTLGNPLRLGTVGANDLSESKPDITIYPNPNSGMLNINLHSLHGSEMTFEICDHNGKFISRIHKSDYSIQNNILMTDLNRFLSVPGSYTINIFDGRKRIYSADLLFLKI